MSGIILASVGNSYGAIPINTGSPAVTGTAQVGNSLSCSTGTWTGAPAPTFTYQWQRVSSNISGATSSSYTVVSADGGNTLRCVVTATNSLGAVASNSNNTSSVPSVGQQAYTSSGTYSWVCPAGVTSASIVLIGGGGRGWHSGIVNAHTGGGGGGGLTYSNSVSVTPSSSYTMVVGGISGNSTGLSATANGGGSYTGSGYGAGGYGGSGVHGNGGAGGYAWTGSGAGGGGAGGYAGAGGAGGNTGTSYGGAAATSSGGAAGGGGGTGGGGVGILGIGSEGATYRGNQSTPPANGGSGGTGGGNPWVGQPGGSTGDGGVYGGGASGGAGDAGVAGGGAVRIIWGPSRSFPSTNTGDQ